MTNVMYPPKTELIIPEGSDYPDVPEDIVVYTNGAGFSPTLKRIVYGPGTFSHDPHSIDTSEKGAEMRRRRIEKKEEELRSAIEGMTGLEMVKAFGDAGSTLWKEVVQNPDQPGRTRADVWIEIGKQAGIVPDRDRLFEEKQGASFKVEGLTPAIARQLTELVRELRSPSQLEDTE